MPCDCPSLPRGPILVKQAAARRMTNAPSPRPYLVPVMPRKRRNHGGLYIVLLEKQCHWRCGFVDAGGRERHGRSSRTTIWSIPSNEPSANTLLWFSEQNCLVLPFDTIVPELAITVAGITLGLGMTVAPCRFLPQCCLDSFCYENRGFVGVGMPS